MGGWEGGMPVVSSRLQPHPFFGPRDSLLLPLLHHSDGFTITSGRTWNQDQWVTCSFEASGHRYCPNNRSQITQLWWPHTAHFSKVRQQLPFSVLTHINISFQFSHYDVTLWCHFRKCHTPPSHFSQSQQWLSIALLIIASVGPHIGPHIGPEWLQWAN